MALEPQVKNYEIKTNKLVDEIKMKINVNLKTSGEKIGKVLYAKSLVSILKCEQQNGSVLVEGNIHSRAMCVLENGDIEEMSEDSKFSQTAGGGKLDNAVSFFVKPSVLECENLSANDGNLTFVQEILLSVFSLEKESIKYVEELNKANQKIGHITIQNITNHKTEQFEISTELDLPQSVSKILGCDGQVCVKETMCLKDVLTICGEVCSNIIYKTNDENPKLKCQTYLNEFRQEIMLSGLTENEIASVCLNLENLKYEVVGELNSKGMLELKSEVMAYIITRKQDEVRALLDAFCPRRELNFSYASFCCNSISSTKIVNEKIEGNFVVQSDEQIDKVVFCVGSEIKDGCVFVKGEIGAYTVYHLDDEQHSLESFNVTIPFESKIKFDENLVGNEKVLVELKIKNVEARNKRTKEIEVLADVVISAIVVKSKSEAVVNDVTLGDEKNEDFPPLGIYYVNKASDLWSLSKQLMISPDVLECQNKDLSFPITESTQIVVFRQKEI